jgi:hypothetical protein
MPPQRSPLRRAFDSAERKIGAPLESRVNTSEFALVLAIAARTRRGVARKTEQAFAAGLHLWGIPAWRDVRHLSRSVARLEGSLQELSHRLEELGDTVAHQPPPPPVTNGRFGAEREPKPRRRSARPTP